MAASCNQKNPLKRSGTHQDERFLKALEPAFVQVDERTAAQLLLFARRFSRHLHFYDRDNSQAGDWLPFFSQDISAILAGLSEMPLASFRRFHQSLQQFLEEDPARPDADLSSHFKLLFHLPLLLLVEVGDYHRLLSREHPLRAFIERVVERDLGIPLSGLISYYKGVLALDEPPVNDLEIFADTPLAESDYNTTFNDLDPRIQLPTVVTERIADSTAVSALPIHAELIASLSPTGWTDLYNATAADTSPYLDALGSFYEQIFDALHYNLVVKTFDRIFQAVERITLEARNYLRESLLDLETHTPHFGLWLAFLRLFEFSQTHLNTLTRRHLDHYYKDILQLCPRDPVPDHAHLLFELNKTVEDHLLEAGVLFKAGKDDLGKEVSYSLDSDFVVNRARVDSLKSFFQAPLGFNFVLPFAAGMTNSADGAGEDLPKDDPQFQPFGPFAGIPNARLGFAVADRQLFLREGNRTITLVVKPDVPVPGAFFPFTFRALLTSEEGWLEISDAADLSVEVESSGELSFTIKLDGEQPPVIPFDPKIHGEDFSGPEPVLRIEFGFAGDPVSQFFATFFYPFLRDIRFTSLELSVKAEDVRDFTLQNASGQLDPSKSFQPFGPQPIAGSPLILGSSELFSKALDQITLNIQWEKALNASSYFKKTDPSTYTVSTKHLQNGKWQSTGAAAAGLFTSGSTSKAVKLTGLGGLSRSIEQTLLNEPFSAQSSSGFMRLELNQDFGHSAFVQERTKGLIKLARGETPTPPSTYNVDGDKIVLEPYTPTIVGISLLYTTTSSAPARFFHLYPFGHRARGVAPGRLFPEMTNQGELYIGVKDLDPPQRLSLLFQTVDGTANPLKEEGELHWHYLRGDDWIELEQQQVNDATRNLTGSGIVGIVVPEDADTDHRLLPTGLHWFRLSVVSDADALNNLLSIDAQAARATFQDAGNDQAFVAKPLPAGTISKLRVADSAIKKIQQPYASFGGKPEESRAHFYVRASERLRHKDRSVTMWDYEHLVLEHFPKVYKVKCINHTELCRDLDNEILADNELKPGHVLLVTIPYLSGTGVDPLRPYTSKGTLVEIDRFLRKRISPFVRLEVQNPKIEEVQVKFSVAFTEEIADISFYKEELNLAIIRYLTPWAYEGGREVSFGGKWHKSAIIDFVEELHYVDYVKDFEMYHKANIAQSDADWNRVDEEAVEATTARSILVSHATHIVQEIA